MIKLAFHGKKVIITGAGRGLGKCILKGIVDNGGTVYALSKTQEKLDQLKKEYPNHVTPIQVDLTDMVATRRVVQDIEPVDMLVNNAAVNITGFLTKATEEDFNTTITANVLAPFVISQLVVDKMISNRISGSIVNVTSMADKLIVPREGLYGCSKIASGWLHTNLAKEVGPHNIRINNVSPGLFPSDMSAKAFDNPNSRLVQSVLAGAYLKRVGTVEEVANAVLFLLHESSSYITGQTLHVCGGISSG